MKTLRVGNQIEFDNSSVVDLYHAHPEESPAWREDDSDCSVHERQLREAGTA